MNDVTELHRTPVVTLTVLGVEVAAAVLDEIKDSDAITPTAMLQSWAAGLVGSSGVGRVRVLGETTVQLRLDPGSSAEAQLDLFQAICVTLLSAKPETLAPQEGVMPMGAAQVRVRIVLEEVVWILSRKDRLEDACRAALEAFTESLGEKPDDAALDRVERLITVLRELTP